jgi:hypothetical protein
MIAPTDPNRRDAIVTVVAEFYRASIHQHAAMERRAMAEAEISTAHAKMNACFQALKDVFEIDIHGDGVWTSLVEELWPEVTRRMGIPPATEEGPAVEPGAAKIPIPPAEMPKIWKVVRNYLKEAGERGAKASEIRAFIQEKYARTVHEKTVGMTLYRLSKLKSPPVRREGHTWFFVPPPAETENPGGEAPGSKGVFG